MSFQNQKNAFSINNMTRLNDDYTEKESRIRNNRLINDYRTFNMGSLNRDQYLDSTNRVGIKIIQQMVVDKWLIMNPI